MSPSPVQHPPSFSQRFAIVLEHLDGRDSVQVTDGGEPVDFRVPVFGIPPTLQRLAATPEYVYSRTRLLADLLLREGQHCPIFYRQGRKSVPLKWTPERPVGRMRMNADRGEILFQKLVDARPARPSDTLFPPFLLDLEGGTVSIPLNVDGWEFFETFRGLAERMQGKPIDPSVRRFSTPSGFFRGIHFNIPEWEREEIFDTLHLAVGGKESLPEEGAPLRYRLRVETAGEECTLVAEGVGGGKGHDLNPGNFALFGEALYERLSPPLRTFKRRAALMKAFFACAAEESSRRRQAAFREAVADADFLKRTVRKEGRELIDELTGRFQRRFWVLVLEEEGWRLLPRDNGKELALMRILFGHFGEKVFRRAERPGTAHLPRKILFAGFAPLLAALREGGFELVLDDLPVRESGLEMEVEAVPSGIDWFEIRPEIRCEGVHLDEAAWRQALASGFVEVEGALRVLDAETLRILSELARLVPGGGKKKGRHELVRIPRLQILDALALRRQGVRVRLPEEDERVLGSLLAFDTLPAQELPPDLHCTLRPYQHRGYDWLAFLYAHKLGACLADDMGLGKTVQTIALLAALKSGTVPPRFPEGHPHLVVVPPSLLFNWEAEIARFAPALRTVVYRGKDRSVDFSGADVVLTSYDLVRRDIARLSEIFFHVIVFDEAQAVKNLRTGITGGARRLRGAFKIALTGTPVENRIEEYWSILDLAVPGLLGEGVKLGRKREADPGLIETVVRRTRPFVLRRTKGMIADELPPRIETDIHLDLTQEQKALYTRTAEAARRTVADAFRGQSAGQAKITALAALMKLRRICLSPRLEGGEGEEPDPKIAFLLEQLEELREEGHSALVFSQFTSFLDLVEPELARQGLPHFRLDGSTPVAERKTLVKKFQESSEPSVFLLSLKAGGRGLNLTRASYVYHLDPWWNPAVEDQASDRAHRIGQSRKVTVVRLLMRHTVEEKMMVLKEKKQRLYKALLGEGKGEEAAVSREEIEFLLGG